MSTFVSDVVVSVAAQASFSSAVLGAASVSSGLASSPAPTFSRGAASSAMATCVAAFPLSLRAILE